MNIVAAAIRAAERAPLPDPVTLAGIDWLVSRSRQRLDRTPFSAEADFVTEMDAFPIAVHTEDANAQHYELPPEFFALILGPQRKYSCCLYPTPATRLDEAERLALSETAAHSDLQDGHRILELGCGWGSLSLFMAEKFPHARIVSVSNSHSQRRHIKRARPNAASPI